MLKRPDKKLAIDNDLQHGFSANKLDFAEESPSSFDDFGDSSLESEQQNYVLEDEGHASDESFDDATSANELSDEIENADESEEDLDEELTSSWFDSDTQAFFVSMIFHVGLLVGFASIPMLISSESVLPTFVDVEPVKLEEPDLEVIEDFAPSDSQEVEIGANADSTADMALSTATVVADVSELPVPEITSVSPLKNLDLPNQIRQAVGLVQSNTVVRGATGVGVSGTDGAIDRVTSEILRSIEERPTLVVWLFDSSTSLIRRREEIRQRFDRIYEELGIATESRKSKSAAENAEEPLLSSVISFGERVDLLIKSPTADLDTIRSAIDGIQIDTSGVEMTFSALYLAADKYKSLRVSKGGHGPERNVMLIAVTDERGDDAVGADKTIEICRKFAIPIYVLGVPAPFGRSFTYIKYVDPDPKFDQSPQWAQIDQGPETIVPERVSLGYEDNFYEEPMIDSGFGPYAISRACYETGGMYFTIHPNRNYDRDVSRWQTEAFASHLQHFFDPERMAKYKPDYLSEGEYMRMISKSPLRSSLIQAAQLARSGVLEKPRLNFVRRDEPTLIRDLTTSQQESARLEPGLMQLVSILQLGETARAKEASPRWLASYDLSYGTAIAAKVRNETYNLMLAKAKRGMLFSEPQNNTWTLLPSEEISVSSKLEKEAELARKLLQGVVDVHKGTPWAYLAAQELERPIGWSWKDSFTDLAPPPKMANNPPPPPPQASTDDQAKMLKAPPPRRPIPKL